jgi:hypothetical protein
VARYTGYHVREQTARIGPGLRPIAGTGAGCGAAGKVAAGRQGKLTLDAPTRRRKGRAHRRPAHVELADQGSATGPPPEQSAYKSWSTEGLGRAARGRGGQHVLFQIGDVPSALRPNKWLSRRNTRRLDARARLGRGRAGAWTSSLALGLTLAPAPERFDCTMAVYGCGAAGRGGGVRSASQGLAGRGSGAGATSAKIIGSRLRDAAGCICAGASRGRGGAGAKEGPGGGACGKERSNSPRRPGSPVHS